MLILLDGFRWDYTQKYDLPNFKRFNTNGVRAEKLLNEFPTLSYPNYYSLTTGLHPENHGMTGNFMWDRERKESFLVGTNPEYKHHHWWDGGWPVWVSVQQQGKVGHTFYWPGADLDIHDTTPSWSVPYTKPPTIEEFQFATTEGLAALKNGTADYVGIYYEKIDSFGHEYGPDSKELREQQLAKVDAVMKELLDGIQSQKPGQKINLMVASDHGMTTASRSRLINITSSILTPDLYDTIMESGPLCNIYLKDPSLEDQVYNKLKDLSPHMKVYKRKDIPDRWHYKHGKYVPLIVCVADLGWYIVTPLKTEFYRYEATGVDMAGMHGFDNFGDDMKGIFYAMGPYFKTWVIGEISKHR